MYVRFNLKPESDWRAIEWNFNSKFQSLSSGVQGAEPIDSPPLRLIVVDLSGSEIRRHVSDLGNKKPRHVGLALNYI
jgi:hypothetical protein